MTITETWSVIDSWLASHAPSSRAQLAAPAPDAAARIEAHLRLTLAPSVREYVSVVPSSDRLSLFGLHRPLSVDEMIRDSALRVEVWADRREWEPPSDAAGEPEHAWSERFLALAGDDGGGGLFADLRDGARQGCVAVWDRVDGSVQHEPDLWADPLELLGALHDALVHGEAFQTFLVAQLEDGHLTWEWQDRHG